MTTLEAAMANTLAAVSLQVDQLNEQRKADFLTKFHNWSISVLAGRTDASNPPQPPLAYTIGYTIDSTNDGAKWAYPTTGTVPVCEMPPLPPASKPYVPAAIPEGDTARNVPVGDTLPLGFIVSGPDGSRWQKQCSHSPFGTAYFYARLS